MAASSASGSSTRKPQSQVWKFFEKASDKSVSCCICHANLAFHGGTSSMKEHLKRKHPTEDPFKERDEPRKQAKLDISRGAVSVHLKRQQLSVK